MRLSLSFHEFFDMHRFQEQGDKGITCISKFENNIISCTTCPIPNTWHAQLRNIINSEIEAYFEYNLLKPGPKNLINVKRILDPLKIGIF